MDFDGANRQAITNNGSININPSWSPDGSRIAFTSYVHGNPDLFTADRNIGRISRISARSGINVGATFAPDGRTLAATLSPDGNPDIYLLNAQSGQIIKRLTRSPGIDASPPFHQMGNALHLSLSALGVHRSIRCRATVARPNGCLLLEATTQILCIHQMGARLHSSPETEILISSLSMPMELPSKANNTGHGR